MVAESIDASAGPQKTADIDDLQYRSFEKYTIARNFLENARKADITQYEVDYLHFTIRALVQLRPKLYHEKNFSISREKRPFPKQTRAVYIINFFIRFLSRTAHSNAGEPF